MQSNDSYKQASTKKEGRGTCMVFCIWIGRDSSSSYQRRLFQVIVNNLVE